MGSYYGLYAAAGLSSRKKPWFGPGLAALLLILTIAFIYSNNMTLMLRPQSWNALYLHSPSGVQLNSADPTLMPRWLFFVAGSFPISGAALLLMSARAGLNADLVRSMTRTGGVVITVTIAIQAILAQMTMSAQPGNIAAAVMGDSFYHTFAFGWLTTALLLALLGIAAALGRGGALVAVVACAVSFLNVVSTVMVRDGIRDTTLRAAGFDVWNRQVVSNWSVIDLFLVLLLAALVVVVWLISVMGKAKRAEESYV
jgi:hypothetical protein